ncbi:hypothetical protein LMG23992_03719 [Cupriavidus laharis]|uniref:Plasmid maintenance system killer protein n=1 Tax=Cupriavidus laharis TaxID=151654 RepID=A0ABM8XE02_9BURK|nr:type II toxin-antitoxin system RelE/ParE family toxin [Cupriavidus laharis]CAG9178311.1 hypothetical protein LMG23992_03719 [Cupriavidus laharis]
MEIEFDDPVYDRLETDPAFTTGFARPIVSLYRRRLQLIRAATDERAFYALTSLHFEKLQGSRQGQYSMRLNAQWRLILRLEQRDSGKVVAVVGIEDYH